VKALTEFACEAVSYPLAPLRSFTTPSSRVPAPTPATLPFLRSLPAGYQQGMLLRTEHAPVLRQRQPNRTNGTAGHWRYRPYRTHSRGWRAGLRARRSHRRPTGRIETGHQRVRGRGCRAARERTEGGPPRRGERLRTRKASRERQDCDGFGDASRVRLRPAVRECRETASVSENDGIRELTGHTGKDATLMRSAVPFAAGSPNPNGVVNSLCATRPRTRPRVSKGVCRGEPIRLGNSSSSRTSGPPRRRLWHRSGRDPLRTQTHQRLRSNPRDSGTVQRAERRRCRHGKWTRLIATSPPDHSPGRTDRASTVLRPRSPL
jgi:hypothetical protein